MLFKLITELFRRYNGESIVGDKKIPRLFDTCTGLGLYLKDAPEEVDESYRRLFRILYAFKILSIKSDFKFIVVIFPQRFQVQKEDWIATKNDYCLKAGCFDLIKPNNLILNFCKEKSIHCIDPTFALAKIYNKKKKSLYFPNGDMHLNALGNFALYESIKEGIYKIIRIKN